MDIDDLIERLPIRWRCPSPGLRSRGGDVFVDVIVTVDAAAVWMELGNDAPPPPGAGQADGLRNACLRFLVPDGAGVAPLSMLEDAEGAWRLPDLRWNERVHLALRIALPVDRCPGEALLVRLAEVVLRADGVSANGTAKHEVACSQPLGLPLLDDEEWEEVPGDPGAGALIACLQGHLPWVVDAATDRQLDFDLDEGGC